MKKMLRWLTLAGGIVVCIAFGCRQSSPQNEPFFFAKQVDVAEKNFDRNQFLSYRKDALLSTSVTMSNESRLSLTPPLPSRLTFEVDLPRKPTLQFSTGVSTLGTGGLPAPVAFALYVDVGNGEEQCFENIVGRGKPNRWMKHQVDLSPWAGKKVRLTFATSVRETAFTAGRKASTVAGQPFLPAWGSPVLDDGSENSKRQDIILISVDCLRADHVSAYGYNRETTPHIDRVAEEGVLFENAMSVSSWTLPTHMSMLTGRMPSQHGLSRRHRRRSDVPYLPEILGRADYETLGVVSGAALSPTFGYAQGFDSYLCSDGTPADEVTDAALELMLKEGRRNRFLFLHLFDAHWPYVPPREFLERFSNRPPDISHLQDMVLHRESPKNEEDIQNLKTLYDSEVAFIDQELGRFFGKLKEAELYNDALIIITADHGEGFYEHEMWQHSEILYNEVTHIPLVVKWPDSTPRDRVERLVSQLHIFPTILEGAGLDSPYLEFPSLHRFTRDDPSNQERQTVLSEITWEPSEDRGAFVQISVRQNHWKYIVTYQGDIGDEAFVSKKVKEELYDLSRDEGELDNLLPGDNAEIRAPTPGGTCLSRRGPESATGTAWRTNRDRRGIERTASGPRIRGKMMWSFLFLRLSQCLCAFSRTQA